MPLSLDKTYEPRKWPCDECGRILGVVMRTAPQDDTVQIGIRKLWVFRVDLNAADVPNTFALWSRPRGMFKVHGVDSCYGVECSMCGALNDWTPSKDSYRQMMSRFAK